jgi:gamma-glutamyltranspeptidase / glutathione hydrolase
MLTVDSMKLVLIAILLLAWKAQSAAGPHGAAATVQPIATDAAIAAMKNGGNAIDGAIAAALTLGVVDGHNSGIGGGCFMLIRLASGRFVALDGREVAPAKATRDMFVRDGKADTSLSQSGPLAAGVPGSLAAYDYAATKFGKLPLKQHLENAAKIAEQGFALDATYAGRLAASAKELKQFGGAFLKPDGSPYTRGEILKQPDLAQSYRAIAREGIHWFYGGEFAERAATIGGGLLTTQDFKDYKLKHRKPIRTTYRGYEIVGFPPPSSGGVHIAQILNILESRPMEKGSGAPFIHRVTEAMKLAFADRAYWLGDQDFTQVPDGLTSKGYAAKLATRISPKQAMTVTGHGEPDDRKHTTHFSVADSAGNWVACTATVNTSFGCKVVVPGTGIVMNNQMDDFAVQPGVANYFGLVGAEANAVAPRKRPLSSMSPTIVLKAGKPILAVGAAGGPTIISQTLLAILYTLDFGMPLEDAMAAPRFHHQWMPDELRIETKAGTNVITDLQKLGHKVSGVSSLGAAQAVAWDGTSLRAVCDPRGEGKADTF